MSIKSQIDRLNAIKERIRTNLVAQGITVPADTMLEAMAEQILSVAGENGERGTGILSTTTGIASYTTTVNGVKPTYRILLSTLKTQANVDKVLIGDHIRYSTFLYPIITLDSDYAYMGTRISLQGSAGASSEWYTGTGITGTSTTATIFSDSGVSSATVGDMYLNTSTYNVYRCSTAGAASAAKWVYVCNIKGDSYTLTDADKNDIADNVAVGLTLGVHTDGLIYIFKNGQPIGNGIEISASGDIVCYVDSECNIILKENREGALPDGIYTAYFEMKDGSKVAIGELTKDTNVYYSVKNTLTNCKNSNSATQVVEGNSYSATITANDGYELKTVTVTMGGSNVSVSGGKINIASVTGNIVITAVAEEKAGYKNLADPTSADWQEGYRLSIGGGNTSALAGHTTTNFIPCKMGDTLRVKGFWIYEPNNNTTGASSDCKIVTYNSSKTKITGGYGTMGVAANTTYGNQVTANGDVQSYKIFIDSTGVQRTTDATAYLRIDGWLMDGYTKNDVIITVNEEITD